MRTTIVVSLATLLLGGAAQAQVNQPPLPTQPTPAPQPTPATATPGVASPLNGTVDVGALFSGVDGDEARYERYRDDRDGLYSSFRLNRQTGAYLFDANAFHVGYRDQRYNAAFRSRRINFGFEWLSTPLNFGYQTRTPYDRDGDAVLTLPDEAQAAVQGPTNATTDGVVGVPCAPGGPPATCSTPAQAALAKVNRSIYNDFAEVFDLRHRRDTAVFGLTYMPTPTVDLDARFSTSKRGGEQPWGASFAFNDAVELPQPLDQRTNDLGVGATWAAGRGSFRLGWDGSWFNNRIHDLTFDNPIRLTDFSNGLTPPAGPYDPSGYSNGNGAATGRQAMMPSNMMQVVSGVGMYRLPGAWRTTINGTVQFTSQTQDEALIPFTTNQVIMSPIVLAAFPRLAQLDRPTAEAEARGINTLINLSARPSRRLNVAIRYRFNDRDVQTPPFDATQHVRFDAVPEEVETFVTHQFDTQRHLFDANASFTPVSWGTLRVGYGHEAIERHGRGFSDVGENIFRLAFDTYTSQYFSVRTSLDVGIRRGEGLVETHPISETEDLLFIIGEAGTQPTLRYYDEADRDRTRGSVIVTVFPRDTFDVYFQFAGTRDRYRADEEFVVDPSRQGELFGLHEQDVMSWNVGLNVHPTNVLSFGASYGRDRYSSLQLSRNANPPPDPSWIDPNRNWTLDNDDDVNNFGVFVDLLRAVRNTDIRFGYDIMDSNNSFVHGGPRVAALTALNQFIPLPPVETSWHRANADVQYFFTNRVGLGVGYYFEKLDIVDFSTIDEPGPNGFAPQTGEPRIDWLGGLTTGYGNRPYTGSTGYVRLLYRF
jgi:hypothetical protein